MIAFEKVKIEDTRLCGADCGKTHCVRNRRNRSAVCDDSEDLMERTESGLCANFLSKFRVNCAMKRTTFRCVR